MGILYLYVDMSAYFQEISCKIGLKSSMHLLNNYCQPMACGEVRCDWKFHIIWRSHVLHVSTRHH